MQLINILFEKERKNVKERGEVIKLLSFQEENLKMTRCVKIFRWHIHWIKK